MNKDDLILNIARTLGASEKESTLAFDIFLQKVSESLDINESFRVPGLGIFQLNKKAPDIFDQDPDNRSLCLNFLPFSDAGRKTNNAGRNILSFPVAKKINDSGFDENAFSLSVDKPLIPIAGRRKQEFLVQSSYLMLQKDIEEKVERLIANSARIEDFQMGSSGAGDEDIQVEEEIDFTKISSGAPGWDESGLSWNFGSSEENEEMEFVNAEDEAENESFQNFGGSAEIDELPAEELPVEEDITDFGWSTGSDSEIPDSDDISIDDAAQNFKGGFGSMDPDALADSLMMDDDMFASPSEEDNDDLAAKLAQIAGKNNLSDDENMDFSQLLEDESQKLQSGEPDPFINAMKPNAFDSEAGDLLWDLNEPDEEELPAEADPEKLMAGDLLSTDGFDDILSEEEAFAQPEPEDSVLEEEAVPEEETAFEPELLAEDGNKDAAEEELPAGVSGLVSEKDTSAKQKNGALFILVLSTFVVVTLAGAYYFLFMNKKTDSPANVLSKEAKYNAAYEVNPEVVERKDDVPVTALVEEGQGTGEKGQGTGDKGQETKDKGQGSEEKNVGFAAQGNKLEVPKDSKADDAQKKIDAKKAEEKRIAEEKKKAEEKRIADEKKKAEEKRIADEKKKADALKLADAKKKMDKTADSQKKTETASKSPELKKTDKPVSQTSYVTEASVANLMRSDSKDKMIKPNIFSDGSRFTIQKSSWTKLSTAASEVRKYRKMGYDSYIMKFSQKNDNPWYRVRIGDFSTSAEAESVLKKLP